MSNHDQFEELSAWVALRGVPVSDFKDLEAHLSACPSCRRTYADFREIVSNYVPGMRSPLSVSARERFLERARAEGLQFSDEVELREEIRLPRSAFRLPGLRPIAVLTVLVVAALGVIGYQYNQLRTLRAQAPSHQVQLRGEVQQLVGNERVLRARLGESERLRESISVELSRTQVVYAVAQAEVGALNEKVQTVRASLDQSERRNSELASTMKEEERRLSEMRGEMQSLRAERVADASTIADQKRRLDELMQRVNAQNEVLERELQFLVADRDIRELMGARNLHIVDVFDVDGRGKNKRAFGRVFYTEGKSLVFYAFDLGDARVVPAKHSFQAWGQREGTAASAVSLGVFYVDNAAQRRWVLKFDDPEVLSHIDAVFVTVEPPGGGKRPTGQKLLYAYLSSQANHP